MNIWLNRISLAVLLACVVARPFLCELSFRTSPVKQAIASAQAEAAGTGAPGAANSPQSQAPKADQTELARVVLALVLLLAVGLWFVSGLFGGLAMRHAWLLVPILAFAGLSLASALYASDKRGALDSWLEQVSLLAAGFLAVQLIDSPKRLGIVTMVMIGLLAAMCAKGLWQAAVEIPARIEQFSANPVEQLARAGLRPGTPEASMFESRVRDTSPFGYFSLANVFGGFLAMLTLVCIGAAVDRLAAARRPGGAADAKPRPQGTSPLQAQVNTTAIAGVLLIALSALGAVVLAMSQSKGAIASGVFVGAAAGLVYLLRGKLARHWRKAVAAALVLVAVGTVATACYGAITDRLPTKSMLVRWYYWSASAEIVRERPLLGAGPANFASAYLQHRRPAAEEAVKLPHNVFAQAFAEYGLPGGAAYLVVLGAFLVLMCRPRAQASAPELPTSPREHRSALVSGADGDAAKFPLAKALQFSAMLAICVLVARLRFGWQDDDLASLFLEVLLPAGTVFAAMMLAWLLTFHCGGFRAGAGWRVLAGAAVAAFVLHNYVEYTLWIPGTALPFWVLAGACVAAGAGPARTVRLPAWALLAVPAVLVPVTAWAVLPVANRMAAAEQVLTAGPKAAKAAAWERYAASDALDAIAAADASSAAGRAGDRDAAARYAAMAMQRDPENFLYARQLAGTATDARKALALINHSVELNPNDLRLRMEAADVALRAGHGPDALRHVEAARKINAVLSTDKENVGRLDDAALRHLRDIEDQARRLPARQP